MSHSWEGVLSGGQGVRRRIGGGLDEGRKEGRKKGKADRQMIERIK